MAKHHNCDYILHSLLMNAKQCFRWYVLLPEITTQQILDYIHCYIYHSYDLGLKFTSKQNKMLNDHLSLYKQQLLEDDMNEFSKTLTPSNPELKEDSLRPPGPHSPHTTLIKRGSMVYNQKIEHKELSHQSNASSDSETEDSLSRTPQPTPELDPDAEETKSDIITPSISPHPSPRRLKQAYQAAANNMIMNASASSMVLTPPHPLPNTSKNIKEKQNNSDSKLIKKIKLSNSKISILRQIIKQNKLNATLKILKNNKDKEKRYNHNHNKFVHILSSYRDLQPQLLSQQKSDTISADDSKSNTSGDQKVDTTSDRLKTKPCSSDEQMTTAKDETYVLCMNVVLYTHIMCVVSVAYHTYYPCTNI